MAKFKPVSSQVDFTILEKELLDFWYQEGVTKKYLTKNQNSSQKFSFLDGPITANNPMAVHHAWGRTYKDLWQRFFNMRGFRQRFQNGFDEQGLWVEVEVEKELGLKSKKDIENLVPGDKFASLEKFINLCKERVKKYSAIQTQQSKRLGYFMDWDNSYHTSSDENNYAIWNFLKVVNAKGWLYKGRDSVPWCPRCGTAISQHEILTEEYQELTHDSLYIEYPIIGRKNEYLLVWTTTPWTLPANVAIAVDPNKDYVVASGTVPGNTYYLSKEAAERLKLNVVKNLKGQELVGLEYKSPFDELPQMQKSLSNYNHQVVATDPMIMPITDVDGTGLVHTAPGAGTEDFQLGKKYQLPIIEVIDESANYIDGLGDFSGQNAKTHPELIINFLKSFENGKFLFDVVKYTHRYPTCWRCKTELVWRVVDEWYIAMDTKDESGKTYRQQMIEVIKEAKWLPKWGYDRELDWLKNMHDWLISKKRYWGLSLPIWECQKCGNFEVVGGKKELKEKAVEGWEKFEGHSPHRPWIDQVKIKCSKCNEVANRIPDVGNPWLDAGIVPFSTLPEEWFPADFITESFPGQFKNWFYSLIAMSTALKKTTPFKNLLGFASVRDEKGEEMHKSKGNAIEFNEAADKIGADVMRWLYLRTNPEHNVNFGFHVLEEIKRLFLLKLWNVYSFFVMYANLNDWKPEENFEPKHVLDRWIISRMNRNIKNIAESLEKYDASDATGQAEIFIDDLSNWYVRRIRDRVGPEVTDITDKNDTLQALWVVLANYSKILAPFIPFLSEEIYRNLTGKQSVHLSDWPEFREKLLDNGLEKAMKLVRKISEAGLAKRKEENIKLKQPLGYLTYESTEKLSTDLEQILADELNVKKVEYQKISSADPKIILDTNITPELAQEGEARELIRQIQQLRKEQGLTLADKTKVVVPKWPQDFEEQILKATSSISINEGPELKVEKVA
ncbi:MAG: isoleucine--tRNA ligase [Candidatus Daviesbacteria bacterium]|nr:MAG: isoleucine--tRNA ligase [Candidatus Daviesbacteria bacterium]